MIDILAKMKRTTLIALALVGVSLLCALLIYMGLADIWHGEQDTGLELKIVWIAFWIQSLVQLALLVSVLLLLFYNGRAKRRL